MRFSMNEIISSFYFVMDLDTDIVESLFWFGFGFGFFFKSEGYILLFICSSLPHTCFCLHDFYVTFKWC